MKTFKLILTALLAAQLLAACTDGEIQMTTTINRNGSCQRMVAFAADSATLVGSYDSSTQMAHLLTDSAWGKTWRIKGDTARHAYPMTPKQYGELRVKMADKNLSDTLLVCAERNFASVEEMGAATPLVLNGEPLRPQVSLTKRFRWFYTDYVYEETYPSQRDLFVYPITDFVEEDVLSYWFTGEPELMLGYSPAEKKAKYDMVEEQCDRWVVANYVAAAFDGVAAMYDSLGDVPFSKADYMAQRDSLVHYALDRQFSFEDKIDTLFSGYFRSHAYDAAFASASYEQITEAKLDAFIELMGLEVDYRLVMPGKIRDVGTGILGDDAIHYHLTGSRLIPADNYSLTATSRAVNVWAFLLTALLIVAVFWKKRK